MSDQASFTVFIESSALIAAIARQDPSAVTAIRQARRHVMSALTVAESRRTLDRLERDGALTALQAARARRELDALLEQSDVIPIGKDILDRAAQPFRVEPVRTLDAIHLATLDWVGEPSTRLTVLTRDRRVAENARAEGYEVR